MTVAVKFSVMLSAVARVHDATAKHRTRLIRLIYVKLWIERRFDLRLGYARKAVKNYAVPYTCRAAIHPTNTFVPVAVKRVAYMSDGAGGGHWSTYFQFRIDPAARIES